MKKFGIVAIIYSILAGLYIILSFILTTEKNKIFWIGFVMVLLSVAIAAAITAVASRKRSSAFPIEISMVVFSAVYIVVVIAVNLILGYIFKVTVNIFVSVHIFCLALYAIIVLLLFVAKGSIVKQNNQVNGQICEMQSLIYEFEKIKTKLIDMQNPSRKEALTLIDSLLDELRFSDFGLRVDVTDIDARLRRMAELLTAEVDNLIAINSDDLTSMSTIVNDMKEVVKDRNMQIKLMNSNI